MNTKHLLLTLFSVLPFLFFSCSSGNGEDDVVTSTEYLNVTSQITVQGDGSQKGRLEINADCAWTITGNPSWMSLSHNSGSGNATVEITCTANPSSSDERSAVLNVASASGKVKKPVTVTQSIANENIAVSVSELAFTSEGGTKSLTITSNTPWSISGKETWIELSKGEGTGNADISITINKNSSEASRTATLTIQGRHKSEKVVIRQEGHVATLSVSPTEVSATATAATYTLTLEGDASWTASTNVDWCTPGKLSGTGSDNVIVSVKDNIHENARTATITFTTNKGSLTCKVTQAAANTPVLSAVAVTDIQKSRFTATATYTSHYDVTDCGFCYSTTNATPTVGDDIVKASPSGTTGTISHTFTGLTSGKTYYIRAYATNAVGTSYGEVKQVRTSGSVPCEGDVGTPWI